MVFYITVLKALAACLITNSHYTGIYPSDIIANGGLLGDVIFFAVSGYCLYHVKDEFVQWYKKRLIRCYVPVIVITVIYMLLGYYSLEEHDFFWWYVYPTNYHFVASIVLLYIPYYAVMKYELLKNNLAKVILAVFLIYLGVYTFQYDKSYYHIDNVRQPMIWFLFFESMLLGAWFRQKDGLFRNKKVRVWDVLFAAAVFVGYFTSKLMFSRHVWNNALQFVNQILLYVLLFAVLRLSAAMNHSMETNFKGYIRKSLVFLSGITLEIYVVQYVIIDVIRPIFSFPLNWFVLTFSILVAAVLLHWICRWLMRHFESRTEPRSVS